jgi:NAD(P)-dependent dehydrogenase (short-subunit alcohol dehydrogenase family)
MGNEQRVALVTGAGGGIGRAVAQRLASAGMAVLVNDYGVTVDGREPSSGPASDLVREIVDAGGTAVAHYGSVADFDTGKEVVETAVERFGRLDLLVTCHGILRERMIFNMSEEEWDSVVDVHLKGTFNCARFATAQMRAQRTGSIVFITSGAGLEGNPAQANYSAAKLGIVGLGFSTALAMGKYGVNVNTIAPVASTRMTDRLTETMAKTGKSSERADAGLIAELALALSDERLRHITGQVYTASGHRLARWSNPFEASEVTFGDDWAADDVLQALDLRLGWQPLRRFAALGLTLPSAASRPSTASAR